MVNSFDFYGHWIVEVVARDAAFDQRILITGNSGSNGTYSGTVGTAFHVSGSKWALSCEWNDNAGSGWLPSDLKETSAVYLDNKGFIVTIGVDDNLIQSRDGDFNDVVVALRYLDPIVDAINPILPPYDFTISQKVKPKPKPRPKPKPKPKPKPIR
jgi:hypothetical protein